MRISIKKRAKEARFPSFKSLWPQEMQAGCSVRGSMLGAEGTAWQARGSVLTNKRHSPTIQVKISKACLVRVNLCPGFGWDRVNFLPSSWYSAVFWI